MGDDCMDRICAMGSRRDQKEAPESVIGDFLEDQ